MGAIRFPDQVKLIAGLLTGERELLEVARRELESLAGAIEQVSEVWPFTTTSYYEDELGPAVVRQFVSFVEPVAGERLADIKRATNELELRMARDLSSGRGGRPVNIDPGYLTLDKLVLATIKDRAHRIYLGDGIFAEVTLRFEKGGWRAWPWTYPDYASPTYHQFFADVRSRLKEQRSAR